MNNSVISAIFGAYLDNMFEGIQALNFYDLQDAYAKLDEFEKKHNISLSEHNDFEDSVLSEICCISERKGFANGFKLALRLAVEMCDKKTERV